MTPEPDPDSEDDPAPHEDEGAEREPPLSDEVLDRAWTRLSEIEGIQSVHAGYDPEGRACVVVLHDRDDLDAVYDQVEEALAFLDSPWSLRRIGSRLRAHEENTSRRADDVEGASADEG